VDPQLECDIVMKGGITSGVVYPRAATELARRYKFRSIGGTSAGAIAAAVVAAAEHNRAGGGFGTVAALPGKLGQKDFMLELFRPDTETRAIFEALVGFMKHGKIGGTLNLFRCFPVSLALPLLLIPAGIVISAVAGAPAAYAVAAALVALVLVLVGLATEALRAIRTLGKNDFGLSHLGPSDKGQSLTPWLHELIQEAAGRTVADPPLTFADLWGDDPSAGRDPQKRAIDLQMMTTNLSRGQPMLLPVQVQRHRSDRLDLGNGLLFVEEEMRLYFPGDVVDHLKRSGKPLDDKTLSHLEREGGRTTYHQFPVGGDMPVVVATRMSLSFPILISAVSLWELDFGANHDTPPLKRAVFSDGGLTSNFPIHLFDSPLPRRPTFGLQLTSFEKGDGPIPGDPGHSVAGPPAVNKPVPEMRSDIDGTLGFLTAVKDAMQNWRDNAQSAMPGYRERIVQIKMARGEGGLNLNMQKPMIDDLTARGEVAGDRLATAFSGPLDAPPVSTEHWNDHRFARYRVVMSVLERFLRKYAEGWRAEPPLTTPYPERVDAGNHKPYEFARDGELADAKKTSDAYVRIADESGDHSLDDAHVPRPPATLRTVPPV
jgi:predicted acylesterase/phospholipase RssA